MGWIEDIGDAINYIEENITEEITIDNIAKRVFVSPFYFQKGAMKSSNSYGFSTYKQGGKKMSNKWYPIIDYVNCAECGSCIDMCSHGVYNAEKAPTPIVINGDGCCEGCHGCGNLCPNGAITYVGDDTGWMPPNDNAEGTSSGCGCGGNC